ncbi:hypothetical protein MTQ01_11510 [Streptomyces sp. XM4193]|uniref:hypothetical protein n=1 Tax=Streptomyces sp. XM4193 TaxID=2929782 RepID=UPI001FFB04EF|nr:hypothetical protein [Streptomyces sp. XM4193]MCK1796629.1 hypothetical protein [Streptomyces sp. XM4193]
MRTLHIGEDDGLALLADGELIAALGPAEQLAAAHPAARERRWAGRLDAGRCERDPAEYLERTYHPDPREAEQLGSAPITGEAALAALELTPTRWGESARRGVRSLLASGVTCLAGPLTTEPARNAVRRAGLPVRDLGHPPRLAVGNRADFTVLAADGRCLATALSGRLLHRTR